MLIEQGFYVSAGMLGLCLLLAWIWPRRDT
jgi:hypothetical protein